MFIQENAFEIVVCEMAVILSLPQCVKDLAILPTPFSIGYRIVDILHISWDTHLGGLTAWWPWGVSVVPWNPLQYSLWYPNWNLVKILDGVILILLNLEYQSYRFVRIKITPSRIFTVLHISAVMTCAKLWPNMVMVFVARATHFYEIWVVGS